MHSDVPHPHNATEALYRLIEEGSPEYSLYTEIKIIGIYSVMAYTVTPSTEPHVQ